MVRGMRSMFTKKIVERPSLHYSGTLATSEPLNILLPAFALEFGEQISCKDHACILHIRFHLGFICNEPRPENVNSLGGVSVQHAVGARHVNFKYK